MRPDTRPALREILDGQADGEGGGGPQQNGGEKKEDQDCGKGAKEHPQFQAVESAAYIGQHRSCDQWDEPNGKGGPHQDLKEGFIARGAIGPGAADEITGGEVNQDQTNNAGPDEVAVAKIVPNQTLGGHFHSQTGHTREEYGGVDQTAHVGVPSSAGLYPGIIPRGGAASRTVRLYNFYRKNWRPNNEIGYCGGNAGN